jgi:hypothetical protein
MRIGVISHSKQASDRPERYVSKNAAAALVRRLLAVQVTKHLIQMVQVRDMVRGLPALPATTPRLPRANYEHHIEPRFQQFGIADTEWMAWMSGYEVP